MKPLVIIPARGGSKGVPRKNIRPLGGMPLIMHTVNAARAVFDDAVICVTTDDEDIADVVKASGLDVPFMRPKALATDTAGSDEVIRHALSHYEQSGYVPDVIVLLQPTSPFRTATHIREALQVYHENTDMVVSVVEASANPYYNLFEENQDGYLRKCKEGNFTRRQDCPTIWEYNGAIYIINAGVFRSMPISKMQRIVKYPMDAASSVDIDSPLDFSFAEFLWSKR